MASPTFVVEPFDSVIGASVSGVDLNETPDDVTVEAIEAALERFGVLVFAEQSLEPRAQVAFSQAFGELAIKSSDAAQLPATPEIFVVGNTGPNPITFSPAEADGDLEWHADHSHLAIPARASLLHCLSAPIVGGDTEFACMYTAYDALTPDRQAEYNELFMIHSVEGLLDYLENEADDGAADGRYTTRPDPVRWPLVRHHPRTGRPSLYFGSKVAVGVEGWSTPDARALVEQLTEHSTRPAMRYRHKWQPGQTVMWDNRRVLHAGTHYDIDRGSRRMHRTTLVEDQPVV